MILEIARFNIKPGLESKFEGSAPRMVEIFKAAKGCRGMELQRSFENPQRYYLMVKWDTVEDHTQGFRGSPGHTALVDIINTHKDGAPEVEHVRQTVSGFAS